MSLPKRSASDETAPDTLQDDVETVGENHVDLSEAVLTSICGESEGDIAEIGHNGAPENSHVDNEIFYTTMFRPMFTGAAFATGVREARIAEDEEDAAREASDDLYALLEVWYPSALDPSAGTFKRCMTVGGFFFWKAQVIRAGLAQRRMQASIPQEEYPQEPEPPQEDVQQAPTDARFQSYRTPQ